MRPFIQFGFVTEIKSSYKYGLLDDEGYFYPLGNPNIVFNTYKQGYTGTYSASTNFYYSTPIMSSFSIGGLVKIINNLYFTFSLNYTYMMIRYIPKKWYGETWSGKNNNLDYNIETIREEVIKVKPSYKFSSHYLKPEIGFSYTVPVKIKDKEIIDKP